MAADTLTARKARSAQIQADRQTLRALTDDYLSVWRSVRADLDDLNHQISEARQAGKTVSPSWLYRQERYKALLAGIKKRVGSFTDQASQRIYNEMLRAYHDGGNDAMALLRASLPDGVSYAFTHPPLAAFEALSRETLGKLFSGYGRETALDVRKALLQGLARGQSPAQIAKSVRDAMSGPLWKALRISRTEVMRAYNSASSATYQANREVLQGWEWLTGPDPCPFCASQAGKVFSVDETLDSHPQCRCTQKPLTRSYADILGPLGIDVGSIPALAG
jgi:SPP1 gp7 family putative phage head morphogenesis protein